MQEEGISTPHIHRTRWDPFSSKCLCVNSLISKLRKEKEEVSFKKFFVTQKNLYSFGNRTLGTFQEPSQFVFSLEL